MFERYAIYYTPEPGSPLDLFGRSWLGRDSAGGEVQPFAETRRYADYDDWIAAPRRYGFHATLKAPFRLRSDTSLDTLGDALTAFAAARHIARAPALQLTRLGRFLALCPAGRAGANDEIDELAGACVRDLDRFRAPLDEADLARRKPEQLTDAERTNVYAWGYPYVFETYRFHMSLTGALTDDERDAAESLLTPLLAPLAAEPFEIASISLFGDPGDGTPFRLIARYPLNA